MKNLRDIIKHLSELRSTNAELANAKSNAINPGDPQSASPAQTIIFDLTINQGQQRTS